MESRAALIALTLIALAGCGDTTASPDQSAGVADMGSAGNRDLGHFGCSVMVDVIASKQPPVPPVTLSASVPTLSVSEVLWELQRSGDPAMILKTGPTDLNVSQQVMLPGTYTFRFNAKSDGKSCGGMGSIDVINPIGAIAKYRLRALPPEADNLVLTDYLLNLTGGQPQGNQDIVLGSGMTINGTLLGPGNSAIGGEVRLIATNGPDAVATTSASTPGAFSLAVRPDGTYQPLLIPQATTLAPHLGSSDTGINFAGASFSVGAGEPVSGSVVAGAVGIAGARLVLRAGALPSGVGTSAADGTFTLRAEAQTYALSVGADQWPIVTLGNVVVPAGGVTLGVAYTVPRVAVAGQVTRADGTTPVAGARVTIASRPLVAVANVTVGGAAPVAAPGHVLEQVISDGNGNLPSLQLPPGTYDLIIDPPPGTPEGLTGITKTLAAADSWALPLQPRNKLSGKITDGNGNGVGAVQVMALELAGLGAAPVTTSGSDGSYSLTVDAGAAILLVFNPTASAKLAGIKVSLAAGSTSASVVLPPGLAVSGTVTQPGNGGKPSVLVEALCYDCGSDVPITSAVTERSGDYILYLPDPGNLIVDGGAN